MQVSQEELLTAAPELIADVLRQYGEVRLRVRGGSMFPALKSGDTLLIRHCSAEDIEQGDIVLVRHENRFFVHRLVEKQLESDDPFLVTRGDSHWRNDPARPVSTLLGRLVTLTRNGRVMKAPSHPTVVRRIYGLAASESTRFARHLAARLKHS